MLINKIINFGLVAVLMFSGCASKNATPEQDTNTTTAGDVAKHIALSPLYVIGGAVATAQYVVIGTLATGLKAAKMLSPNDSNASTGIDGNSTK